MTTWLHELAALEGLADHSEPGMARDWATSRLAVLAPQRYRYWPLDTSVADVVMAANPPQLFPSLAAAIEEGADEDLITSVGIAFAFGIVPDDPRPIAETLRRAAVREPHLWPWVTFTLAEWGLATPEDLGQAQNAEGAESPWLLPTALLRFAEKSGQEDEIAKAIVDSFGDIAKKDPMVVPQILVALGVPWIPVPEELGWEQIVEFAAESAGGVPLPLGERPKGNPRKGLARLVERQLGETKGAGAAFLRAAARAGALTQWASEPLFAAAWLRAFVPGDPVTDVFEKGAAYRSERLIAARRAIGPGHREVLVEALRDGASVPASVLAVPLLDGPEGELIATELVQSWLEEPGEDPKRDASVKIAAVRVPELVVAALADPERAINALALAEWIPSVEVLEALLAMEPPESLDDRVSLAFALASMGDLAVANKLVELMGSDPDAFADPLALFSALTGAGTESLPS